MKIPIFQLQSNLWYFSRFHFSKVDVEVLMFSDVEAETLILWPPDTKN